MDVDLKFVIDEYDPWICRGKKRVNINRRNRDELMKGYTDKVYSWSISRYLSEYIPETDMFEYIPGPHQITGELDAEGVIRKLNTDYCFDFDYEPNEKDILFIQFHYRNPEIKGRSRPYIYSRYILLYYNGKDWEKGWRFKESYEEIYRGILQVSPK